MEVIQVTPATEREVQPSQPIAPLDDNAVREAIARAESQGQNPEALTIGDLQAPTTVQPVPENLKTSVPEKFITDGVVDVEKLKASTKQLDEAIQAKEQANQKTIEDYLAEYREKEAKFRNTPNPEKLAKSLPQPTPPVSEGQPVMTREQFLARLDQDLRSDLPGTISDLVDILVDTKMKAKMAPIEDVVLETKKEKEDNRIRNNLKEIAARDSRVLDPKIYAAINAKLESDPDLWRLKNPHKAAWLEVKEEMRLGEPNGSAQPSKPATPILGGGTPPPIPSSSSSFDPRNPLSALQKYDIRDKKQESVADQEFRAFLASQERR